MKEVIEKINSCTDTKLLEDLKNKINKRLVELTDTGMTIQQKIFNISPLATRYDSCIPSGSEKSEPQELMTDFMDDYMYIRREKNFDYVDIVSNLIEEFNGDGIELRNGDMMTTEQYNAILSFIYDEVKNGVKGFCWDW